MIFKHKEPGPLLTVSNAARLIADTEVEQATVARHIRHLAKQENQILPVRGTKGRGRTASNLFALSDVAVAKIHLALGAARIQDRGIGDALHNAAYWKAAPKSSENPNAHPITEALLQCAGRTPANVPPFEFRLEILHSGGVDAFIRDTPVNYEPYEPTPLAAVVVPLFDWLPKLAQHLEA